MNATRLIQESLRSINLLEARPCGLGMSAVVLFLQLGCATQNSAIVTQAGPPPLAQMIQLEPGSIGLLPSRTPAQFSFEKSIGRTAYASDGASDAACAALESSIFGDAILDSVKGVALAPLAAIVGGIYAGQSRMPAEKLFECETNLSREMAGMADQKHLRNFFLKAAAETSHRRVVPVESMAGGSSDREPVSALLETTVEELRLERTGTSDTSFALLMKTRARLVRLSDGAILYNQPFEYRSGTALFVDWTLHDALKNVAETSYRKLAQRMAQDILVAAPDAPVLLGGGYGKSPNKIPAASSQLAANRSGLKVPRVQFVSNSTFQRGALGIYSAPANSSSWFALQQPLTKSEAVSDALEDVEWSLDGFCDTRNEVVRLTGYAIAVPLSLWKQSVGVVRGLTEKQYRAAHAQLSAAVYQAAPQQALASQVVQQLGPRTSQPVVLVHELGPTRTRDNSGLMRVSTHDTPELVLEIHVINAGLKGKDGINPGLSLLVDAQATLLRNSDGQEIYSCPVHYRSNAHKFTEWAENDARAFREESEKCYREIGRGIVEQLESKGLIAPGQTPQTTFADNAK